MVKINIREIVKNNKRNYIIIGIIFLAFLIRLFFFIKYANQPLWWDETENLLLAKHFALGTPDTGFALHREIGLPLILTPIFFLGLGELGARFFMLIISVLIVFLTYKIGKRMFNEWVAYIASFLMSVFYLNLFFTLRFTANLFDSFMWLVVLFLFYKYIDTQNKWYVIAAGAVGITSMILFYFAIFLVAVPIAAYMLIKYKLKTFKKFELYLSLVAGLLAMLPFMIYFYITTGWLIPRLGRSIVSDVENTQPFAPIQYWNWLKLLPTYLTIPLLIMFIIAVSYFIFSLIISFKSFVKGKNEWLLNQFICFLIIFDGFLFIGTIQARCGATCYLEPRFLLYMFPFVFMFLASVFYEIGKLFFKDKTVRHVFYAIVICIFIYGSALQLQQANNLIAYKGSSFDISKDIGLWLKDNTNPDDVVVAYNIPINTYYSERETYSHANASNFYQILDKYDAIRQWEKLGAKYLVYSADSYPPEWYRELPQKNKDKLEAVKVFTKGNNVVGVVYKIKDYNLS